MAPNKSPGESTSCFSCRTSCLSVPSGSHGGPLKCSGDKEHTPHHFRFIIVGESGHYCHIKVHFLTLSISRSQGSSKIKSGPLYQQAWCSLPEMVHAKLSPRLSDETDPDKSHQQLRFSRRCPARCAWYCFISCASDSLSNFARHVPRV